MMLMAQADLIKFCKMRNVFKCKYVRSAQKVKLMHFLKGEEVCVKEEILKIVLRALK